MVVTWTEMKAAQRARSREAFVGTQGSPQVSALRIESLAGPLSDDWRSQRLGSVDLRDAANTPAMLGQTEVA